MNVSAPSSSNVYRSPSSERKPIPLDIIYIPVKITYAEGCKYVIRMINHLSAKNEKNPRLSADQRRTVSFWNDLPNDWLYDILRNLSDHKINKEVHFPDLHLARDQGVRWFLVICKILQDKGYIQAVKSTDSWLAGGYQITLPL